MGREIGCAFGLLLFGQISLGRLPQSRPPLSRWLPIKSGEGAGEGWSTNESAAQA